jgi:hypothetical protein
MKVSTKKEKIKEPRWGSFLIYDRKLWIVSYSFYFPLFVLLQFLQSIWQFSAVVLPPACQGVI